jgi:hypothetical protein
VHPLTPVTGRRPKTLNESGRSVTSRKSDGSAPKLSFKIG